MRSLGVLTMVFALTAASPLFAQGRNSRYGAQGVPPGQMPPAGMCRVWYDGVPPGRQPRPTSCNEAERLASRDRNARVIYGDNNYGNNDRTNNYPYGSGNNYPYGTNDRYGYPNSNGRYGNTVNGVAYDKGYQDGLEKGRKDADDRNSYDPVRHSWYRSGDRGYNSRYGTRDSYKLVYRDGFEAGYDQAYRSNARNYPSSSRNGGFRIPRPF